MTFLLRFSLNSSMRAKICSHTTEKYELWLDNLVAIDPQLACSLLSLTILNTHQDTS